MSFDRILSKKLSMLLHGMPGNTVSFHGYTGSGKSVVGFVMPVLRHITLLTNLYLLHLIFFSDIH